MWRFPSSSHIIFIGSQNQQGGVVRSEVVEAEAKLMVAKGIMAQLEIVVPKIFLENEIKSSDMDVQDNNSSRIFTVVDPHEHPELKPLLVRLMQQSFSVTTRYFRLSQEVRGCNECMTGYKVIIALRDISGLLTNHTTGKKPHR
ncbi:unnamed protein product [Brassica oleracea]|uniref:(rape) hypothetical protein n=1 Tax=Brassica napus TaxID=3708 RepID=A0A816U3K4_BRANA|nr:unnamed protein product [Brassica napus]